MYLSCYFFVFKLFYEFSYHLHLRIYTLHLYYICISNRSILWIERTKKSLLEIREFWAIQYKFLIYNRLHRSWRRMTINRNVKTLHFIVKRLLLHSNCTSFALQMGFIYLPNVVHLQCKEALNWREAGIFQCKNHQKLPLKSLESIFVL